MSAGAEQLTAQLKQVAPERLTTAFRWANVVNAVLLVASGVIAFTQVGDCGSVDGCSASSMVVLAFYVVMFAVMLLLFELKPESSALDFVNNNFGFMYSNRGRATLLLFLATLTFSTVNSHLGGLWVVILLVGLVTTLNGCFVCVTIYLHPSFDEYSKAHAADDESMRSGAVGFQPSTPQPVHSNYQFGDASGATSTPFATHAGAGASNAAPRDHPFATGNPFSTV
jgi:hypothetical protein